MFYLVAVEPVGDVLPDGQQEVIARAVMATNADEFLARTIVASAYEDVTGMPVAFFTEDDLPDPVRKMMDRPPDAQATGLDNILTAIRDHQSQNESTNENESTKLN
jgi:hypothetical protein